MELKERVRKLGITHKKLADLLGTSQAQLSYWLNGTRDMPESKRKKLRTILDRAEKALN